MKKCILFVLIAAMLASLLAGCQTTPPADTDTDSGAITADSSTASGDTEPAGPTLGANSAFDLVYGEPSVIMQGVPGDNEWGHYQFPTVYYNLDGNIVSTWSYSGDNIYYLAAPEDIVTEKVSEDGGVTWRLPEDDRELVSAKNPMHNGNYFVGFPTKGSHAVDWLDEYTPAITWGEYKMFFHEDLPANEDTTVQAQEYDPKTGKINTFDVTINWPNAPVVQFPGKLVYPFQMIFSLNNRTVQTIDGDLYMCLYFYGFDSEAKTHEEAIHPYSHKYSVYVFKSVDNGRTWDYISQVLTNDFVKNSAEGLCEPEMSVMPDGSVIMVMRTGSNNTSYYVRSASGMKTWSSVMTFDEIGVLPQLVTLDCGITISTYGRPYMRVRATSDPKGIRWEKPETFQLTGGNGASCYYTDLLALDETTALWIYSDFVYPNEDGEAVKSVIARTITVVPQ